MILETRTAVQTNNHIPNFACCILNFAFKIFPHPLWIVENFLCRTIHDQNCQHLPVENCLFIHNRLWIHTP